MNMQAAIDDYIVAHEIQNSSAYTIVNHRKHLGYFASWLLATHRITDTDELQLTHLRGWISYLQKSSGQRDYSQTVTQLQRSHEEYSPLRIKKSEHETGGSASGYWDE